MQFNIRGQLQSRRIGSGPGQEQGQSKHTGRKGQGNQHRQKQQEGQGSSGGGQGHEQGKAHRCANRVVSVLTTASTDLSKRCSNRLAVPLRLNGVDGCVVQVRNPNTLTICWHPGV